MQQFLFLFCAGVLAGGMNAIAGGGTFISLPALIAVGISPVAANASSTVALVPASFASAWTYYDKPMPVCGTQASLMLPVTMAGGLVGSLLLLWTPAAAFDLMLPWLLLLATLMLAFGRSIGAALRGGAKGGRWSVLAGQLVLGVYGGYFGGAMGLMMMAYWTFLGERDVKALQAPRTMMVTAANAIAVVTFVLADTVRWPQTAAMLLGGVAGGYGGARLAKLVPAGVIRLATLGVTASITAAFFFRAYG